MNNVELMKQLLQERSDQITKSVEEYNKLIEEYRELENTENTIAKRKIEIATVVNRVDIEQLRKEHEAIKIALTEPAKTPIEKLADGEPIEEI